MKKYIPPLLWVIAFQIVSALIGMSTSANMGWYDTLEKSALTPPDITFPIVWTTLYIMLALAGWLIWKNHDKTLKTLFAAQMLLNWGWSFIFFKFHLITLCFFWIVALNILMATLIIMLWKKPLKAPALLILPTLLWGSFAAYLNYQIWALN